MIALVAWIAGCGALYAVLSMVGYAVHLMFPDQDEYGNDSEQW